MNVKKTTLKDDNSDVKEKSLDPVSENNSHDKANQESKDKLDYEQTCDHFDKVRSIMRRNR